MTEPTDAELSALLPTKLLERDMPPKVQVWLTQKDALAFARAALAKWGTPAPVGVEPTEEPSLCNDPRLCCRSHPHDKQDSHCQLREVAAWLRWHTAVGKTPSAESMNTHAEQVDAVALALRAAPVGVGEVAEHYRSAIASACEGWTMPDGLRKLLETALWSPPTPQPTQPQAGAVPLTPERIMELSDRLLRVVGAGYVRPQDAEGFALVIEAEARRAALTEAERICDHYATALDGGANEYTRSRECMQAANAIRALKEGKP